MSTFYGYPLSLFVVVILMKEKNHEILTTLHYKPQRKMGLEIYKWHMHGTYELCVPLLMERSMRNILVSDNPFSIKDNLDS